MTVVIADGKHLVSEAVRAELDARQDLQVLAVAQDGLRAIADVERLQPAVAILDANLANCDGLRATSTIRQRTDTNVVLVADSADEGLLADAVIAGATGFVSRDEPLDALVEATRALGRGEVAIPPRMLPGLLATLVRRQRAHDVAVRVVRTLTPREQEILAYLADGASNEQIAQRLVISPQTVRTHTQNLLRKLAVHSRVEAAAFVHRNGIGDELRAVGL